MISNPLTGASYVLKGLRLIGRPRILPYVIVPLLINSLLFSGLIWLSANYFAEFIDQLMPSLPEWLAWLSWLLWLLFALAAMIIVFFTFTLLANLIGAPFNSYLSAAVESYLTGNKPSAEGGGLLAEAGKAISGELKKQLYFIAWALPLVLIAFIPGINLLSPLLWAFFGAWMMSIEYADYPLGNLGMSFPEIRRTLKTKSVLALGFGGAVMLSSIVPVFNFLIMPIAVAGATAMRVEQFK